MKKLLVFVFSLSISLGLKAQEVTWLKGSWKGTDDKLEVFTQPSWKIEFTYTDSLVKIHYPNFHCGGEWSLKFFNTRCATFTEKLTYGKATWIDGRTVVVHRLENNYCRLIYFNPHDPDQQVALGLIIKQ